MSDFVAAARQTLDHMVKGDFAAVNSGFTAALAQALPPETLKGQWNQLVAQVGAFKEVVDGQHAQADGMDIAALLLQFEQARIVLRLVYKDGVVVGMHMMPPTGTGAEKK